MDTVQRELPPEGEPQYLTRTIETIDDDARTVQFVASDESVDRFGDIVKSDWNLAPFRKNPVFLWNHNYSMPPVGTVPALEVVGKRLMITSQFIAAGMSDFADQLFRLVRARVLRAVSVGFTVKRADVELITDEDGNRTGGLIYHSPELLEISLVSVPANPKALAVGRALGVPVDVLERALPADALVEEQQRKLFAAMLAIRVRGVQLYGPR